MNKQSVHSHSQANEIVTFGDVDILHEAASVTFICADEMSSEYPQTYNQLVKCHAVCWNGFRS